MKTHPTDSGNPFAKSREDFESLVQQLEGDDTLAKTHSEVEALIRADGMELFRKLFQDHLDLRKLREVQQPSVMGADEIERTHRRESERGLESIFGGVRRLVAKEVAGRPFEQVLKSLHEMCAAHVPKRQAEEMAVAASVDFEAFYADPERSVPGGRESILVISADGKGVFVRFADLREATRKAAELEGDENGYRKRMSTVAAVYSVGQFVRRPEDIIDEWRRERKETQRPRPKNKRVLASIKLDPEEVIRQAFEEAMRRDPEQRKTWVGLVDGDLKQIAIFEKLAKEFGVEIVIVLDIMHSLGYLWEAGHALHGQGTQEARNWVAERFCRTLHGEARLVASGMKRSATNRGMSANERKAIDDCTRYFKNHQKYMRYHEYLQAGMPIATGVIEGACRYLVKDRMEVTGARWGLAGAEAVLRLRAIVVSGDFDDYWRYHEAREAERNHAALFALPNTPKDAGAVLDPVPTALAG